jgi:hypothetical protein
VRYKNHVNLEILSKKATKKLRRTTRRSSETFLSITMSASRLGDLDIHCVHAFFATLGLKRDGVTFADFVNQAANVNEDFLAGGRVNDKAEAFGLVEELDGSFKHY